jgi:hypothetical protein
MPRLPEAQHHSAEHVVRFCLSIRQRAVDFAEDQACRIAVIIAADHKITDRITL